jgi:hypothetical protein
MHTRRRLVLIPALAIVLAACGATPDDSADPTAGSDAPSSAPADPTSSAAASTPASPSADPSEAAADAGTFSVVSGGAVGGPGITLGEAIGTPSVEPVLVNGILLMDRGGTIWFCESLADTSPPSCDEPRLVVVDYPKGGAEWDLNNAGVTGLEGAEGVLWLVGQQLYGVVAP